MEFSPFTFGPYECNALEHVLSDMYVTDLTYSYQSPVNLAAGLAANRHRPTRQLNASDVLMRPDPASFKSRPAYVPILPVSPVSEASKPPVPLLHTSSTPSSSEGATYADDAADSTCTPADIKQRRKEVSPDLNCRLILSQLLGRSACFIFGEAVLPCSLLYKFGGNLPESAYFLALYPSIYNFSYTSSCAPPNLHGSRSYSTT